MNARSIALGLGIALALGVAVGGETDFHNCGICKPMMAEPGLMQNMKWETRAIATGMLSVTTVHPDHEATYARVHAEMMANVAKLEDGAEMPLCPFCQGLSRLSGAGARIENVDGAGAHVMAVTSQDPAVIEKIHAHAKWVEAEHAKLKHAGPKS